MECEADELVFEQTRADEADHESLATTSCAHDHDGDVEQHLLVDHDDLDVVVVCYHVAFLVEAGHFLLDHLKQIHLIARLLADLNCLQSVQIQSFDQLV